VFEDIEDYQARIDDPTLDIDESCVMVLKNCGPREYPGMAEVRNTSLPAKILARGVTDTIRISDARMGGTAHGTVVLRVAPEAAVGGPLALVRSGELTALDVEMRSLQLRVSETELARRRCEWKVLSSTATPGYQALYVQHTLQANRGRGLDFPAGPRQDGKLRESH
jgi:L-arabonate dehydrase